VLIAAITSCTNTSNPSVLIAAGLLARKARERGLVAKPWVKTSLAPGSRVVTDYLQKAGLLADLEAVGFYVVGYGCTTCIGNSGPLRPEISDGVRAGDIVATSVLSGNRNFEGRVHAEMKMNFLASPPLVVAYALAGTMDIDLDNEPLGTGPRASPSTSRTSGRPPPKSPRPSAPRRLGDVQARATASVFDGRRQLAGHRGAGRRGLCVGRGFHLRAQEPAVLRGHDHDARAVADIKGARALAVLGDSVTTDHISPAGNIARSSPAAKYLMGQGRAAGRLQPVRRAPRQPRSDDARHVRQHPPAQPAAAGHRRRRDAARAHRRADVDLRRGR
jgi:aconitate hydratase